MTNRSTPVTCIFLLCLFCHQHSYPLYVLVAHFASREPVVWLGLSLWCLMPRSTIFQLYRGGVLLVEETRVSGETIDLP